MKQENSGNWDVAHKAAEKVVNSARTRYVLSNEEVEDCISALLIEFAPRVSEYDPDKASAPVARWIERSMWLRLPNVVDDLRDGGLTGETDEALQLCGYDMPVPNPRGHGDKVFFSVKDQIENPSLRPRLCDVLAHPQTEQTLDEAQVDALLSQLGPDDAELLSDYYGLGGREPQTFAQLAASKGYRDESAIRHRIGRLEKRLRQASEKVPKPRTINRDKETINADLQSMRRGSAER